MADSKGFLGNTNIGSFKLGTSDVKLYLGTELIYPLGETMIVAEYEVSSTSNPTKLFDGYSSWGNGELAYMMIDNNIVSPASQYTFSSTGQKFVKYKLASSIAYISSDVFNNCPALRSISLPSNVNSIGSDCFNMDYDLTGVTMTNNVTSIGYRAFASCGIVSVGIVGSGENVELSSGITYIESETFKDCGSLLSAQLPEGVTTIGQSAFDNCLDLRTAILPSTVTYIDDGVFNSCGALDSITIKATTPPTLDGSLTDNSTCVIYVPAGSIATYQGAQNWSVYASRFQAIQ